MAYARLKKRSGKTLRSKGYTLKKDSWIEINDKDVLYFASIYGDRVEFAPNGIVPDNQLKDNNSKGVIVIEGQGKESIVSSKENKINDEFLEQEQSEIEDNIQRIKEKYHKKRIKKEEEEKEKNNKQEEYSKLQKAKERVGKIKKSKIKDITNPIYVKEKEKKKGFFGLNL